MQTGLDFLNVVLGKSFIGREGIVEVWMLLPPIVIMALFWMLVDSHRLFNYDWALRLTVNAAITEFEDMTDSDNVVDSTHFKG